MKIFLILIILLLTVLPALAENVMVYEKNIWVPHRIPAFSTFVTFKLTIKDVELENPILLKAEKNSGFVPGRNWENLAVSTFKRHTLMNNTWVIDFADGPRLILNLNENTVRLARKLEKLFPTTEKMKLTPINSAQYRQASGDVVWVLDSHEPVLLKDVWPNCSKLIENL